MMENRCEAISDVEVQPKTLRKVALDAIAVHSKEQSRLTLIGMSYESKKNAHL